MFAPARVSAHGGSPLLIRVCPGPLAGDRSARIGVHAVFFTAEVDEMVSSLWSRVAGGVLPGIIAGAASAGVSPFAAEVVSFSQGTGAVASYANPANVLGSPTRFTGVGTPYPGAVTPFNPAWGNGDLYSIGSGGHITVRFGQPVVNDPANPFGIDLLIFGNSFFSDPSFDPVATVLVTSGGGTIEVSPDGSAWTSVPGIAADGLFPTLGYTDGSDPWGGAAGASDTDFTRPVNPAFDWHGRSYAQLIAGYAGSGGGAGIDIGALGLSQVSFVRVSHSGAGNVEIDAFSDVSPIPAPASLFVLAGVLAGSGRRR